MIDIGAAILALLVAVTAADGTIPVELGVALILGIVGIRVVLAGLGITLTEAQAGNGLFRLVADYGFVLAALLMLLLTGGMFIPILGPVLVMLVIAMGVMFGAGHRSNGEARIRRIGRGWQAPTPGTIDGGSLPAGLGEITQAPTVSSPVAGHLAPPATGTPRPAAAGSARIRSGVRLDSEPPKGEAG